MARLRVRSTSVPSTGLSTVKASEDNDTAYHFKGSDGIERFWKVVSGDGARLADGEPDVADAKKHVQSMRALHLYLSEDWHTDFFDDILTDALTSFLRYSNGGETLHELFIHVEGDFLFTKHVYILPAPCAAMSYSEPDDWFSRPFDRTMHRLQSGRLPLSIDEKSDLMSQGRFEPLSRPKAFLQPLLQLRNIQHVEISGPMEPALQYEIIRTIGTSQRLEFDGDEEEDLRPGELWDMERIPRDGWERSERQGSEDAESGHDHGVWVFPTAGKNRVTLGWPLERAQS